LEQAREALFQAQKMEAVGQLTGGVAHDFNNLLMVILGNLDLLRKRLPDDPRTRRLLENTVMGAQRGAALTQRMLAFAQKQDLTLAAVDLPRLVQSMGDLFERTIGSNIAIDKDVPDSLPQALADAHQLELALLNLVVNARDAMPEGGAITIGAEVHPAGRPDSLPAGNYIRLRVEDTGGGMDAETLAKAQEPFFTTKGVGKGTGLGLSMVKGVAEQSGGAFRLLSEPGQGTIAEIWLPVADVDQQKQPVNEVQNPVPLSSRRLYVLVVDHDPLVLENTAAMLDDLGHLVTEARSGEDALAVLCSTDAPADVLIADQMMPGMTGLELIQRVREIRPGTAVVLASGFADLPKNPPPSLLQLAKPFDQAALDRAIRTAAQRQSAVLRANPKAER
jgi:CheY-like chemotaxis protein/two-component sensor histidine kinase